MIVTAIITLGYYFLIESVPDFGIEIQVRTGVTMLALFFVFIWLPVIKSEYAFHQNFMAVFKGLLQAALYAGVIFLGYSLILSAVDLLIVDIDENLFPHGANIIFVLFAPIFFLSLVPIYQGKKQPANMTDIQKNKITRSISCPKFLEVLLSYIIIPIAGIYTIVLILYIVLNISGEFWTNNLLEPLLVAYAVTVIIVFMLVSELKNKFALFFIRIFPKVLIPIVVFQIIASILISFDTGFTFTRYYVIIFGIFAAISGVIMSIFKTKRNGYVAAVLIIFCIFSVIPPLDAFTTSRNSQIQLLESTLEDNDMLVDNEIIPKDEDDISEEDRSKITMSMDYLYMMDDLDHLEWLPDDFELYDDFYDTFGFAQYRDYIYDDSYQYFSSDMDEFIDISDYDQFIDIYIEEDYENTEFEFEQNNETYYLEVKFEEELLTLSNDDGDILVSYDLNNLFYDLDFQETETTSDKAIVTITQNSITMTLLVNEIFVESSISEGFFAHVYVFIGFE